MRKKKFEITDISHIESILRRCMVGRFAVNGSDGYPYVVPLNFVYWQNSIYFHSSTKGEKIESLLRDPRACFEVDIPLAYLDRAFDRKRLPCKVDQFFHSVIIKGRAEVVEDPGEKLGALNALMGAHEDKADYSEITAGMEGVNICAVIALRIESMTAKSNLGQSMKDEDKKRVAAYLQKRNLPGDSEAAELIRP